MDARCLLKSVPLILTAARETVRMGCVVELNASLWAVPVPLMRAAVAIMTAILVAHMKKNGLAKLLLLHAWGYKKPVQLMLNAAKGNVIRRFVAQDCCVTVREMTTAVGSLFVTRKTMFV